MTASQLIRQAALKTGAVKVREKIIEYTDPPLEDVSDTTCWLCGGETGGKGMSIKKAIKPTFTDHPFARGHGSSYICPGCALCLSARELRNYSILATADKLFHPTRAEWRDILINPPAPPFVMCLAVSGQKHLTFKAPVNLERERFTVLLEERPIFAAPDRIEQIIEAVEALYIYFSKDEILTGRYSQHRIKECGLSKWERLEAEIECWRGRPLFDLALFVAQKLEVEQEKAEQREAVGSGLVQYVFGKEKTKNPGPVQATIKWS
jgi:CRISPR type IV-associated protein Csf1